MAGKAIHKQYYTVTGRLKEGEMFSFFSLILIAFSPKHVFLDRDIIKWSLKYITHKNEVFFFLFSNDNVVCKILEAGNKINNIPSLTRLDCRGIKQWDMTFAYYIPALRNNSYRLSCSAQ